jgi:hypothetical protein
MQSMVSKNDLIVRTVFPGRVRVRTFSANLAGSGNSFELHAKFAAKAHTEFTKTVRGYSPLEQLSSRSMILLLNIRGNCSCFREKAAHMVDLAHFR